VNKADTIGSARALKTRRAPARPGPAVAFTAVCTNVV